VKHEKDTLCGVLIRLLCFSALRLYQRKIYSPLWKGWCVGATEHRHPGRRGDRRYSHKQRDCSALVARIRFCWWTTGRTLLHERRTGREQSLVPDAPDHVFHHDTEGGLLCRGQRSGHGNTGFFCLIDGKHNGNPVEPFYIHEAEYVERFADVLQTDGNNRLDAVVG